MRFIGGLLVIILLVLAGGIATGFIDLQKTRDGQLPQIAVKPAGKDKSIEEGLAAALIN